MPILQPFGPGNQQMAAGAVPDFSAISQQLNAWSQYVGGPYGNAGYTTQAGAAYTKTPAMELGGIHVHTGASGAVNVTMSTAADLYAAYPGAQLGSTWTHLHVNLNSGTDTLVTASGITLAGTTTILTTAARMYVGRFTACPVPIIGMSYSSAVVTLTTSAPHGLAAAGSAIVANMSNSAFNGTFTVASVPNAYQLTYALPVATAFATDSTVPNITAARPALLNTAPTISYQGAFSWPAIMVA